MSWTRLDDLFTDRPVFETLDHAHRWHYLALVQMCSRDGRSDGVIPVSRARRASDVPDPDAAHAALAEHSLIEVTGASLRVVEIADHIPPPHIRENAEKSKIRMRRSRAHKAGDHALCLPDNCPEAPEPEPEPERDVTASVTRNTGTGQDGTGRAGTDATTTTNSRTRARTGMCEGCGVRRPDFGFARCTACSTATAAVPNR